VSVIVFEAVEAFTGSHDDARAASMDVCWGFSFVETDAVFVSVERSANADRWLSSLTSLIYSEILKSATYF
jgi:hypothetical protein